MGLIPIRKIGGFSSLFGYIIKKEYVGIMEEWSLSAISRVAFATKDIKVSFLNYYDWCTVFL